MRRPEDPQARPDATTLVAFALLVVLAGGNAVGIDIAADELDPFWAASLRFAAAGLIFAALMGLRRIPLPQGGALVGALLYGGLSFGAAFGIAFVAIPMTGAGAGQLLLGLVPLLTLLLVPIHGIEPFRLRAVLGGRRWPISSSPARWRCSGCSSSSSADGPPPRSRSSSCSSR